MMKAYSSWWLIGLFLPAVGILAACQDSGELSECVEIQLGEGAELSAPQHAAAELTAPPPAAAEFSSVHTTMRANAPGAGSEDGRYVEQEIRQHEVQPEKLESDSLVARQISSSSDLIGGLRADGRIGDFYLANEKVRAIVQNIDHGALFFIFGGNLIDADIQREAGEEGQDLLGELFVDVDLNHALQPSSIEVVSDGSDSTEARIRVVGTGFTWPLFPPKEPVPELPMTITQDYVLHPGESFITMETTVKNTGLEAFPVVKAELLLVGSSLEMNAGGLPPDEMVGRTEYITMKGSQQTGASYGYTPEKGQMTVPFEDAAQTGVLMGNSRVAPGQSVTWSRYFVIGDRDAAAITDQIYELRGERLGWIEGAVFDPSGTPVAEASLTLVDGNGNYLTQCLTDASGAFRANLPPGEVSIRVVSEGRLSQETGPYTIQANTSTPAVLSLNPRGRVQFSAVDEEGEPCPVRLSLYGDNGKFIQASYRGGEELAVPPGDYTAYLSRGVEYDLKSYSITVPEDGGLVYVPPQGPAVLSRVVDSGGWISGDFHLHQKNSNDSWTLLEERVTSLLAEGVEVAIPTEHDRITDLQPTLDALGLNGHLVTAIGNEVSVVDYGHFNYFPIQVDVDDPEDYDSVNGTSYYFGEDWMVLSASELFEKMRQNPGQKVIQVNHPRSDGMGYFSMIGYNSDTGRAIREELATDFDAIEIKTDVFGDDSILPDYFSLINQGLYVSAMGNSDAHRGKAENGYPRTYLRVANDTTEATTMDDVLEAILGGHTVVSSGIFVDVEAEAGGNSAGPGDVLNASGQDVALSVRVQCPVWTSMSHFALYANGQALPLVADGTNFRESAEGELELPLSPSQIGGRFEQSFTISVDLSRDTYYLLLAWGDGNLSPVGGDHTLGYTSAIYVDKDGNGFEPPGLGARVDLGPRPPEGYRRSVDRCAL